MTDLDFLSEDAETGGSKRPTKTTLRAIHPDHGEVGWLKYFQPRKKADGILVDRLEVHPESRGNGYASALMDEMQRRHPQTPINHGDRTDDGKAWWAAYSQGKPVRRGRTMAGRRIAEAAWSFEHHQPGTTGHRMFGGPPDEPRRHMVEYDVSPDKKIDFGKSGSMGGLDRVERKGGLEAVEKMRAAVFAQHPGHTEYDPQADAPPPEKPQRRVYYHGTTVEDVTHVLPANQHGQGAVHGETDRNYAYATPKLEDAWDYAQKAWDNSMGGRRPRVYQVRPIGGHQHVEEDPQYSEGAHPHLRGNNENDMRSKKGFEVVREMAWPKHMGDPKNYEESW
jgi:GNAT superfamily N-acetyltransferase